MIKVGKDGSVVLFWENLLISSLALGKYTYDDYMKDTQCFIELSLRKNHNFRDLVKYAYHFCNTIYKRKLQKKKISTDDHYAFAMSLFTLLRMKLIDFDDHILIAPRKKVKSY